MLGVKDTYIQLGLCPGWQDGKAIESKSRLDEQRPAGPCPPNPHRQYRAPHLERRSALRRCDLGPEGRRCSPCPPAPGSVPSPPSSTNTGGMSERLCPQTRS